MIPSFSKLFGLGLDYLLQDVSVKELVHMHEDFGMIVWVSSIILWALTLNYVIQPYITKKFQN